MIHAGARASLGSGTRAVSASAFEFISENSQIASVHEFMHRCPKHCGADTAVAYSRWRGIPEWFGNE